MRKFALLAMLFMLSVTGAAAQDGTPVLTNTEYDIGLDCPVAHELDAEGTTLWVLMEGCFSGSYSLQAFNVADGTRIENVPDYSAALEGLRDHEIIPFTNPMAILPDGTFSIIYSDGDTYAPRTLAIAPDATVVPPAVSDSDLLERLLVYTEYPEYSIFSADHTQAATVGTDALDVVDLATGESVFSLPLEHEMHNAYPSFSADGATLYVAQYDEQENFDNPNTTLSVYSLSDGALLNTVALQSATLSISPDGQYAAAMNGSNDGTTSILSIVDLATGGVSESIDLYEPPQKLMACANDGRSMSDVDFTVTGRLAAYEFDWLPDSRSIVYTRDYRGEAAGGGRPCAFNTSRLNRVEIAGE